MTDDYQGLDRGSRGFFLRVLKVIPMSQQMPLQTHSKSLPELVYRPLNSHI